MFIFLFCFFLFDIIFVGIKIRLSHWPISFFNCKMKPLKNKKKFFYSFREKSALRKEQNYFLFNFFYFFLIFFVFSREIRYRLKEKYDSKNKRNTIPKKTLLLWPSFAHLHRYIGSDASASNPYYFVSVSHIFIDT